MSQDYAAWFVDYPRTHVKAGQTVEVVPRELLRAAEARLAQIAERLLYIACDEYQAAYGAQNGIVRVLHEFGVIDDSAFDRHLQPGPPDEREGDRVAVRSDAKAALRVWRGEEPA